ncbi:uncharacterized protein LOC136025721 [Artemia franciscana]|uniref:uncharacterized protein LOC136025721 n=1 Tax=Artemia franciscana TaxID=6661 RepID=UPI0032DBBBDE
MNFGNIRESRFEIETPKTTNIVAEAGLFRSPNKPNKSPNPNKMEIIKQLKPPNNQNTCRSVCRLLSYFRRYFQNYANIAKPLTDLLNKSGNIECPPAAVEALSRLKQELLKAPVLELPSLSHDFAYKRMHHQ